MTWIHRLEALGAGRVDQGASLQPHTTLRVGGGVNVFLHLSRPEVLPEVLKLFRQEGVPYRFLGNGSNVLAMDGGFAGAVIHMGDLKGIRFDGEIAEAESGVPLIGLIQAGLRQGLTGMEWACGIPGSVGGAVVMNAGSYGKETKDHLVEALLVRPDGTLGWVEADRLDYTYRHSALQSHDTAVLAARFRLAPGDKEEGQARVKNFLADRKRKQPVGNNAGSMFKNPPGDFAGRLIEAAGGKGRQMGQAKISDLHANFFLNLGGARAADIMGLAQWAGGAVLDRFGISLVLEVEVWGEP